MVAVVVVAVGGGRWEVGGGRWEVGGGDEESGLRVGFGSGIWEWVE